MKNSLYPILLFFLLIQPFSNLNAQVVDSVELNKIKSFAIKYRTFANDYPQEKVYLHFDNTGYYLGETIWFKAYVVTAEEHLPTTLSRVLYVELLNPEGDVVITKKLKVENGQCHGDFQLKDSLFAGYYEVRAYTRYLLNFGNSEYWSRPSNTGVKFDYKTTTPEVVGEFVTYPYDSNSTIAYKVKKLTPFSGVIKMLNDKDIRVPEGRVKAFGIGAWEKKCIENNCMFSRVFPVYNRPKTEGDYSQKTMFERPRINIFTDKTEPVSQLFKVAFYPEGGSLVKGLTSNLSFKAVDDKGKNIEVRGVIKDKVGKAVSEFRTQHEGMGSFSFVPQEDTYTAEVYYGSKIEKFNLPTCDNAGYVMTVHSHSPDTLSVLLNTTEPTLLVGLSITCRGKVADFRTLNVQALQPSMLNIPTIDLPTGVNQLTLFNQAGKVLAERLVFVNHQDYKDVSLSCTHKNGLYKPTENIQLDFQAKDVLDEPVSTTFSVAVRDAETEDISYYSDNIQTNLLLSSDLKGYITNPAYYFQSDDQVHRAALDLLMLTQGWRRYVWKEMAGVSSFELKHPIEKGIMIDGAVNDELNEKVPNADVKISLEGQNNVLKYGDCKADLNGNFKALVGDIKGDANLTLVALKDKRKNDNLHDYLFALNRHFSPEPQSSYSYYQINIPIAAGKTAQQKDSIVKSIDLKTVTVKAKKTNRTKFDYSKPNYRLSAVKEVDEIRDLIFLNDRTPGNEAGSNDTIRFLGRFLNYVCMRRGFSNVAVKLIRDLPFDPDVARNGWYSYSDLDSIYIYSDLASRKRFTDPEAVAKGDIPDIVLKIISTKTDARTNYERGVRRTKLQGYSYVSDFYSPDYKNNALPEKKDFRRTLYWNPDVKTDSNGKAQVSFYNNSTCKRINISAETVTKEGETVVVKD